MMSYMVILPYKKDSANASGALKAHLACKSALESRNC